MAKRDIYDNGKLYKSGDNVLFDTTYQRNLKGSLYADKLGSVYVIPKSKVEGSKGRSMIYLDDRFNIKNAYRQGIYNIRRDK